MSQEALKFPESPESPESVQSVELEQLHAFVHALVLGDFSARLPEEGSPRAAELARNLNTLMERMSVTLSEITHVCDQIARGQFGGQAENWMPPGPWRQCVESVNLMSWTLSEQLRDMTTSVKLMADGKPSRKVGAQCKGETLDLKNALNAAIERVRTDA